MHCNWRAMFIIITVAIIMFLSKYNKIKNTENEALQKIGNSAYFYLLFLSEMVIFLGLRIWGFFILPHSKNPSTSNFTSLQAIQLNGKSMGFGNQQNNFKPYLAL